MTIPVDQTVLTEIRRLCASAYGQVRKTGNGRGAPSNTARNDLYKALERIDGIFQAEKRRQEMLRPHLDKEEGSL